MKRVIAVAVGVVLFSARASCAGGLGIPLDGFLAQFQTDRFLIIRSRMCWPGVSAFLRKRACSAVAWP